MVRVLPAIMFALHMACLQGPEPAKTGFFGNCQVPKFWNLGGFGLQSFGIRVDAGLRVSEPGWVRVSKVCYPGGSGFWAELSLPSVPQSPK